VACAQALSRIKITNEMNSLRCTGMAPQAGYRYFTPIAGLALKDLRQTGERG
jgi:hypothetical protein